MTSLRVIVGCFIIGGFQLAFAQAPTLTSISPTSLSTGMQVTLTGNGFGATQGQGSVALSNSYPVPVVSWSNTQVVVTVPAGTTPGGARVGQNGAFSNSVSFTMVPPTLTSISPTSLSTGMQVTLTGSGFGATQGQGSVALNNSYPVPVVSWSDTQVVVTVPAGTTPGGARVGQNGVFSNSVSFTMVPPTLTSISPTSLSTGMQVTLTGSGFGAKQGQGTALLSNSGSVPVVSWSDTQVVVTVPTGTTSGNARVGQNGVYSNSVSFTVVGAPTISSLSPTSGVVTTTVTISGTNLGNGQSASVTFNGVQATPTNWTNTSITVPVPSGATTGNVVVTIGGLASNGKSFTVAPAIASLSPTSGPIGSSVTVGGSGFGATQGTSTVTFNGTTASPTSWSSTSITVPVPTGATTGNVIATVGGIASNGVAFTVAPTPTITTISPPAGASGSSVVINGSGFGVTQGSSQVEFNGVAASTQSWSDSSIQATVSGSGPVTVVVTGVSSNAVSFTLEGPPTISSFSPNSGMPGTVVTINGSGFGSTQSTSTAAFAGVAATVDSWSDSQIVAVVPATSTGPVSVTVGGIIGYGSNFGMQTVATLTDSRGDQTTYTSAEIGGVWVLLSSNGPGCSTCSVRNTEQNTYDATGNLLTTTDANNNTVTFTYDANNNMLSRSAQLNGSAVTTSYTYNNFGEVLTMTDPLGNVTTNAYDSKGNLTSVTTPPPNGNTAASVTQFGYDTKGELTQITDPLNHVTTISYYPTGLIQSITDAQNNITSYTYDARGNRTSVADPINGSAHPTTFAYDVMNRLTGITYPDGTSVGFGYDYRGRRTSATDQNNRTTTYAYDDADRLLTVTDPASHVTAYNYDTEGNLTSITDADNNTTSFTYDPFGRVTQTTFPSTLVETYGYDAVGNLTSKTDRKGQKIQYIYDALYRLTSKTYPDSTSANYVYDLVGKIQQVNDPTGTYSFAYDNMGRLTGTTTTYSFLPGYNFQNSYGYDAASNRTSLTAPDGGITTYGYDTLNRLNGMANSWAGSFGFGYDALGRRTQLTRPNGITTNYTYDAVSHLLSVLHQAGVNTFDGASYTYDPAGNRVSKTNYLNGVTSNYLYDPLYELTQVTQGASTTESYSYDSVGNRLSSLGVSNYSYNASNELTANSNGSFTYDANGNTLSDAQGRSFTWDFENRLTQAVVPGANGGTTTFRYDPLGRRIHKSGPLGTTTYIYDGDNLVEEVDNSGNVSARYARTIRLDEELAQLRAATTSFYQADALASITSLSNSSGAVANSYTFDSFGNLTASTGTVANSFRYTGREFDPEVGVYQYRARYYDPNSGRFLSEDPIRFKGNVDFYSYVRNNPVLWVDPTGLIHQAWNEPPFDGRLHDDPGAGLEVLCTKGRDIHEDMNWLERSIFVRSVEIDALGNDADAGHIDRRDAEIATLVRCHDECDKDKKPEPHPEDVPFWERYFNNLFKIWAVTF